MTLAEQYAAANDPTFASRVGQAMCKAAVAVQAEATNTANHTNRANFATLALRDPERYQAAVARAVVTNAGITSTAASDNDVEFTVNSMWNAFAGTI